MTFEHGPYVQVAALCEKVLTEQDGVLSLIRIIDRLTHTAQGPGAPTDLPAFDYSVTVVLSLKSGRAKGRHQLRIQRELPSGELDEKPFEATVHLEGGSQGTNVIVGLTTRYEHEGVYWFNVSFDDELLTRMPFEIRYAKLPG